MKVYFWKYLTEVTVFAIKILVALAIILAFTSCKTKQKAVQKKASKVSFLEKKDVNLHQSTTLSGQIFRTSKTAAFEIRPEDAQKTMQVIYAGDTLKIKNGRLHFSQSETQTQTAISAAIDTQKKDKTKTKISLEHQEKTKKKHVESTFAFPWVLVLLAAFVFLVWKFKPKILNLLK